MEKSPRNMKIPMMWKRFMSDICITFLLNDTGSGIPGIRSVPVISLLLVLVQEASAFKDKSNFKSSDVRVPRSAYCKIKDRCSNK